MNCKFEDKNYTLMLLSIFVYYSLILCITKTSLFTIKVSVVSDEDHLVWLQSIIVVLQLSLETTKTRKDYFVALFCFNIISHVFTYIVFEYYTSHIIWNDMIFCLLNFVKIRKSTQNSHHVFLLILLWLALMAW